ncbi:MAG: DedA family protein [Chloroflexi bacterium]|nr:DedA family protein [Chloroflexota bacterium]
MHLSELLNTINTWAQSIISSLGYPGLGLVMFLENIFPPIPSEIVLPLAGSLTLTGRFTLVGVTLVGAIGSVAGALFFYGLGYWFDESRIRWLLERYGKWLMLDTEDLDRAMAWFGRFGEYVIFFGRMVPIVRSLISVPAGLARMNLGRFCFYTSIGTALWSFLLALAGRILGQNWTAVSEFVGKYEDAVLVLGVLVVVAFFAHRLWLHLKQRKAQAG